MKKKVTLSDIAQVCATSVVTVSKALSNKDGVGEELREKIKHTAEEMGYTAAKSSSSATIENIGVIVPEKFINPNGSFYWALYNFLIMRFKKENMYCIMENLSQHDEENIILPKFVADNKIGGLISLGQLNCAYAAKLSECVNNMLLLDYYIPGLNIDSIVTNGYSGGYKLTSYLIKMGHKKIGFIGSKFATSSIFDRYMGYLKAMIENGLPVNEKWTIEDRDCRDFIEFQFPKELPTAFVCNCDEAAYHAIKQLKAMGYDVPNDISIVGYDNYLMSEVSDPPITTINVDAEYMADLAVKTIIDRVTNPDSPTRLMTIEGELVIKKSAINISNVNV